MKRSSGRSRSRCAASVGDFAQPLPHPPVHVVQIGELAQRPEVLTQVTDGAFDFPFFPAACGIACVRDKAIFTGETEEARLKADETSVMFSNCGGQVVISDLTCNATQFGEGMNMTADESFEALAMRELDIHHAAVSIDQGEGIQLTRIARIIERAEVAPVNLEAFPGDGFHADEGAAGLQLRTHPAYIFLEDARSAFVTEWSQALFDDSRGYLRVLLQPFGDVVFEGIEFARTAAERRSLRRRFEIFVNRAPAHFEMALDFADGPALGPVKPVQVVDLFGVKHRLIPLCGRVGGYASRLLFARRRQGSPAVWKCFDYPDLRRS